MKNTKAKLNGQRIGIFGRGGCGKSTTTVFLAQALREAGYPVAVLDADSTNEGLARALGADRAPDDLLEWFGGTVFSGGPVSCPVDDPLPQAGAHVHLRELPDRFFARTPDDILLFQAGKIGPLGPGAGCDGPMTKIARDFTLETEGEAPVMLLDFKAGIEDASRGVITSLDWVVGVIDPTGPGVRAAVTIRTLLDQMHAGGMPATRHLGSQHLVKITEDAYRAARTQGVVFVLNKVADLDAEFDLCQLLVQSGIQATAAFAEENALRIAWLKGLPLESASARSEAGKIVRALKDGLGRFSESPESMPASPTEKTR